MIRRLDIFVTCHLVVKHKIRNWAKIISFEIKYSTFPLPALFPTKQLIKLKLNFSLHFFIDLQYTNRVNFIALLINTNCTFASQRKIPKSFIKKEYPNLHFLYSFFKLKRWIFFCALNIYLKTPEI